MKSRKIPSTLTFFCLLAGGLGIFTPQTIRATVTYSGVAAGDATDKSAILWTRTVDSTTQQGVVSSLTAQVSTDPHFGSILYSFKGKTNPNRDYILKLNAVGLQSGTRYYYHFQTQKGEVSRVGTFKTAPGKDQRAPVRFSLSGDANGLWRPYSSTQDFDKLNLDFFIFDGDVIYETASQGSPEAAKPFPDANLSQALADYRRKYREQLVPLTPGGFPGLQTLFAAQGNYTLIDNHELGNLQFINGGAPAGTPFGAGADGANPANDVNTTKTFINQTAAFKTLEEVYNEYEPVREKIVFAPSDPRTNGTQQLYLAQQWGANSIFINVDDRSYRDIRLKMAGGADDTGPRADNPKRTMLGATQLAWLKQKLLTAQKNGTTWKFVAVSSPIDQGGDDAGKSWIGGYRAERNSLLKFIADNGIDNVVFLSTDDHELRINEMYYLADPNNPHSRTRLPSSFSVIAGPIGSTGPDVRTKNDHNFRVVKAYTDARNVTRLAKGIPTLGLAPNHPGLKNVFRDGDPDADILRQPVDFYSPDTYNYVIFDISADGKTLMVNSYGVNAYSPNAFLTPAQTGSPRRILGFEVRAAQALKPTTAVFGGHRRINQATQKSISP